MRSEFLARLSEEMLEYFRDMADVLVEHCGIGPERLIDPGDSFRPPPMSSVRRRNWSTKAEV
ncbi:hypothetical protein ACWGI9_16390 [Streptomyces sp. NPDC054833]